MKKVDKRQRLLNSIIAKLKTQYPHLYYGAGTHYVREMLRDLYGLSKKQRSGLF